MELTISYPIRSIGFIPTGVALAMLLYASSLPSEIKPLVPALQNAPLLTIHVGMAVVAYGIFATSFAAGVAYLVRPGGGQVLGRGDQVYLTPVTAWAESRIVDVLAANRIQPATS